MFIKVFLCEHYILSRQVRYCSTIATDADREVEYSFWVTQARKVAYDKYQSKIDLNTHIHHSSALCWKENELIPRRVMQQRLFVPDFFIYFVQWLFGIKKCRISSRKIFVQTIVPDIHYVLNAESNECYIQIETSYLQGRE